MVSNYDRIFAEITREAAKLEGEHGRAAALTDLAMEVVDIEDQHRTRPLQIQRRIEDMISKVARHRARPQDRDE